MARSLLFGTSVSPGIAIGVLRFAHNVQTVEMRRISPREVEGEQEQLRAAVTNLTSAAMAPPLVLPVVGGPLFPEDRDAGKGKDRGKDGELLS